MRFDQSRGPERVLDGGIPPQPSSMILRANGATLYCDGVAVREMGVNAYDLLINYLDGTSKEFLSELPLIAQHGFRFVRIMGGPHYPNGWSSTYDSNETEFFRKIARFLDVAQQYGLGIILSVFWRHATQADIAGETVNQLGVSGSATRNRCATILQKYAQNFSDHPALSAWEIGNEYSLFAANGAQPVTSFSNGTPASYSSADVITLADMRSFFAFAASTIRSYDTSGRIILSGNAGPGGVIEKGMETYRDIVTLDNPDPIDTLSIHQYSNGVFGSRNFSYLKDMICEMQALSRTESKPFILGEFGMSRNETYGGYGGDSVFRNACDAIYRSGCQLALAWNWKQDTSTGSNNFNIHPLNTVSGMNVKAETLKEYNVRMQRDGYFRRPSTATSPSARGGQNIVVTTGDSALLLSAADDSALKPSGSFAVSFWVKLTRDDLSNRRIARKYGGNAGWHVSIDASTPYRTVYMQIQKADGSTQSLATQCQQLASGAWRHYGFQLDTNAGSPDSPFAGLSCFENGVWVKTLAFSGSWSPSTDDLLFFSDSGPANPFYGGLRDFRLHNRALSDDEWRNLYLTDESPLSTVAGEWSFNGSILDSSGNGNDLSVVSGAVSYESFAY